MMPPASPSLAGLYMLRNNVGIFDDDLALLRGNGHDLALLAAVLTAEDNDGVTGFHMNFTHCRTPPIKELPGQGKESSCTPCRAAHAQPAEDTSAPGVFVVTDDNGRILVETDVGAVLTANAGSGSHDNRLHNIALLNNSAGCCFFNGSNHDVADICIPPACAARERGCT